MTICEHKGQLRVEDGKAYCVYCGEQVWLGDTIPDGPIPVVAQGDWYRDFFVCQVIDAMSSGRLEDARDYITWAIKAAEKAKGPPIRAAREEDR